MSNDSRASCLIAALSQCDSDVLDKLCKLVERERTFATLVEAVDHLRQLVITNLEREMAYGESELAHVEEVERFATGAHGWSLSGDTAIL